MAATLARFPLMAVSSLLIVALADVGSEGQNATASPPLSSPDHETQKLFPAVLSGEKRSGQCRYDVNWAHEKLPDYIADAEFNVSVQAGRVPPSEVGDFRSLIDPARQIDASSFCSDTELKTYTARRVREFEKGSASDMQIDRTAFAYPIYDRSRTKAVVIIAHLTLEGRFRSKEGQIVRHPPSFWVGANVYRKNGGQWQFVRSITIGST